MGVYLGVWSSMEWAFVGKMCLFNYFELFWVTFFNFGGFLGGKIDVFVKKCFFGNLCQIFQSFCKNTPPAVWGCIWAYAGCFRARDHFYPAAVRSRKLNIGKKWKFWMFLYLWDVPVSMYLCLYLWNVPVSMGCP